MKKILFVFVCIAMFLSCKVYAYNTPELNFSHEPGKYIYCNNPENIKRSDLADNTNYNAKYIMNNDDLTADRYALFLSHYNHTHLLGDDVYTMLEPGFDIEVDVQFKAKEDTVVRIDSLGFEVTSKREYWLGGKKYVEDTPLGCMTAWASYLKMPVRQIDSGECYQPIPFEPVAFEIKSGETVWLSQYIPNYSAIELYRVIHLMADFEILSGRCDINVAALKSNGSLGDRSHFNHNALRAAHFNERQYKGISDSLNRVTANLDYIVDYYVYHGMRLPVMVYNNKIPDGNVVSTWHTHLNPSSDWLDASGADESNMLSFTYKDDSKLGYYGVNVPENEKENVWYFDTSHNDLVVHQPGYGPKAYFKPNTNDRYPAGYSHCNLGNYGVFETYNLSFNNTTESMRYVSYKLKTGSNNIIILYDEHGNVVPGYPLCKGYSEYVEEDTMACIALPPHKTTKYTLTVILPTNYYGDMAHSLVVNTEPETVQSYSSQKQYVQSPYKHTGKEFYKWDNQELYFSPDTVNWTKIDTNDEIKKIVYGRWKNFALHYVGDGYVLRADNMGGIYFYFPQKFFRDIYFLDEDMNITSSHQFIEYPSEFTYAKNAYYTDASLVYTSTDKSSWSVSGSGVTMPVYNYGRFVASFKNNTVSLSADGINFMPVVYENNSPSFIESYAGLYYWLDDNEINFSHDGIYWYNATFTDKISSLYVVENDIVINETETVSAGTDAVHTAVVINGKIAGYAQPPYIDNGVLMVSASLTNELLGLETTGNDYSLFVPLRQYAESLGYTVTWDSDNKIASVTK